MCEESVYFSQSTLVHDPFEVDWNARSFWLNPNTKIVENTQIKLFETTFRVRQTHIH